MSRVYAKVQVPYYPDHVWSQLRSILHGLLGKSDTKCAKAMGVSRATWKSWANKAPSNPWMVHSLYYCCFTHFHSYQGKYGSEKWKQRSRMAKRMQKLHKYFDERTPHIEQIVSYSGAEKHVARKLSTGGMYFDELRKPPNAGGYSPRQLRIAAHRIGVVMTQKGFGEDNESWWEWPDQTDEI